MQQEQNWAQQNQLSGQTPVDNPQAYQAPNGPEYIQYDQLPALD